MKHYLLLLFLLLGAAGATNLSAQSSLGGFNEDHYNSEVRQKLNLDYSMPDYMTHKVDPNVMGPRLASILQELLAKYKQDYYLNSLSSIQADQIEGLDYCTIEKMSLESVSKTDNTISIGFKTTLTKNPLDLKKSDIIITFVDGVSDSKKVNDLFAYICNYMK